MKIQIIERGTTEVHYEGQGHNYIEAMADAQRVVRKELAENGLPLRPMSNSQFINYCDSIDCHVVVSN